MTDDELGAVKAAEAAMTPAPWAEFCESGDDEVERRAAHGRVA